MINYGDARKICLKKHNFEEVTNLDKWHSINETRQIRMIFSITNTKNLISNLSVICIQMNPKESLKQEFFITVKL